MSIIRFINILRGAVPKFFLNLQIYFSDFLFKPESHTGKSNSKKILLIRTDGIGDFIQWLPCARQISDYYKGRGYSISLLGNSAWLSFAQSFNLFNAYIPFNRNDFLKNSNYKKNIVSDLNRREFEIAIYLPASREFSIGDSLMKLLSANQKIGYKGDNSNDASFWLKIGEKPYTFLINISDEEKYEPYLNLRLLAHLSIALPIDNVPKIENLNSKLAIRENDYFIVIPGSNMNLKQWSFENFLLVARKIIESTNLVCVFCGGEKEQNLMNEYKNLIDFPYENYINKTTLEELAGLISNSKFVLANDTGAVHIAAGLNKKVYCIYGGGHFGRFLPYKEEKNSERILPDVIYNKMQCFNCNWKCKYQITKNKPAKCVESITVEQVWNEIKKDLSSFKTSH